MQKKSSVFSIQYVLGLSLLCHLLFFLCFFLKWRPMPKLEERPQFTIKAYAYQKRQALSRSQEPPKELPVVKEQPRSIDEAAVAIPTESRSTSLSVSQSLRHPVRLIGDKEIDKSLLKAIGEALSGTLIYPPLAIDFQVKGKVLIGFSIHPNGRVTEVQLVRSSGSGILDDAAFVAVADMSPVGGAGQYLKAPRFLVIGIIFG